MWSLTELNIVVLRRIRYDDCSCRSFTAAAVPHRHTRHSHDARNGAQLTQRPGREHSTVNTAPDVATNNPTNAQRFPLRCNVR